MAHEALIRRWQRLRDWINHDREFLRTCDRITAQARRWEGESRPSDRLLPPGRPLAEGEDLLTRRRDDLEPLLVEYIEASAAAAETNERQKRHRTRAFMVALAMVALIAVCFGGVAWWQRGEANRNAVVAQHNAELAERNAEQAQRNADEARRNLSRALAGQIENEVNRGSPAAAVRLALATLPMRLDSPDRAYARVVEGALFYSLQHLRERRRINGYLFSSLAFSPDGRTLATGSIDGTAELWEIAMGKKIGVFRHGGNVTSVAFSPDGRTLATGYGGALLWDLATGKQIQTLVPESSDGPMSVAFSPDGRTLATGSGNTARLWNRANGKQIRTLTHKDVSSVAFSPDGRTLATGSGDTARLWEVTTGKEIVLGQNWSLGAAVAFSPDGRTLAISFDGDVRLWEVATAKEIGVLDRGGGASSLAFSTDGGMLVAAYPHGTAKWEVVSGKHIANITNWLDAVAVKAAFSPVSSKESQTSGLCKGLQRIVR